MGFIPESEAAMGMRLGCAARVSGDLLIAVPEASSTGKQVVDKGLRDIGIKINPSVKNYTVTLSKSSINDRSVGEADRIATAVSERHGVSGLSFDLPALRQIPMALEQGSGEVTTTVWMDREIIRIQPSTVTPLFGFSIDIGTTTVAGYLCNLETGEVAATVSMMNPQYTYGEDVMARITYHMHHEDGLARMKDDLLAGLNELALKAASEAVPAIRAEDIVDVTICCNTVMHHILLGLDPSSLGVIPFSPVVQRGLNLRTRDMGIAVNPGAKVYILPNEAGFLGADNVAVLMAESPHNREAVELIIDIGTNGEIVLGNRDGLMAASCATGPALEGAQIRFGMRAAPGAIERVTIQPDTFEVDYKVIGRTVWRGKSKPEEMQARGICGSGIIDAVAQMALSGVIHKSGAFNTQNRPSKRLRENPATGMWEFIIAPREETCLGGDLVVTQGDIRQVQLAKAALYAGCKLLMRKMGVASVTRIKIAGAFGTHVDHAMALALGLVPDISPENILSIGNAAGDGCRMVLLDREKRLEAEQVAKRVHCVELTLEPGFQDELVAAIHIPHMRDSFSHLNS